MRVVVVGVLVEKLRHVEPAGRDGDPRNVPFAGQRKLAVGHVLLFAAQSNGLADKEVRKHEPRSRAAGFVRVRIGKGLEAKAVREAEALPHQQIGVKLGTLP